MPLQLPYTSRTRKPKRSPHIFRKAKAAATSAAAFLRPYQQPCLTAYGLFPTSSSEPVKVVPAALVTENISTGCPSFRMSEPLPTRFLIC